MIVLASLLPWSGAFARHGDSWWDSDNRRGHEAREAYPSPDNLDEVIERVRARSGGKVLSAEPARREGRMGYRIKLLTPDNRVRILFVPAE